MALPADTSSAWIEEELPAARELCRRIGWRLSEKLDSLALEFLLNHPATQRELLLHGDFKDYRALCPAWRFLDPKSRIESAAYSPAPGQLPSGAASIFHNRGICAPFNRLAYAFDQNPGIHADWGGPTGWLGVGNKNEVRATNIGEMLQVIRLHLSASPGTRQ